MSIKVILRGACESPEESATKAVSEFLALTASSLGSTEGRHETVCMISRIYA